MDTYSCITVFACKLDKCISLNTLSGCGGTSVCLYVYNPMCGFPVTCRFIFPKATALECMCVLYVSFPPGQEHKPRSTPVPMCVHFVTGRTVRRFSGAHSHVYTATSFSSNCSPSGRVPRSPGRRALVLGLPSSSRQRGTRPCFLYGSHTQQCLLQRARPPREPRTPMIR